MYINKVSKLNNKNLVDKIKPLNYTANDLGLDPKWDGSGVRIAVLGSGISDTSGSIAEEIEIFCDNPDNIFDKIGISHMAVSLLLNQNEYISGMATGSSLYMTKIIKNNGEILESSVVAGILWSLIKGVDIVLLPFPVLDYNNTISKTIRKAIKSNILFVAPYHKDSVNIPYMINVKGLSSGNEKWNLKYNKKDNFFTLAYPKGYKFYYQNSNAKFGCSSGQRAAPVWMTGFVACLLNSRIFDSIDVSIEGTWKNLVELSNK